MGKEIVYCGGCGKSLREEEFERGKAHTVDNRPFCVACKPLPAAPPPPAPSKLPPPSSSHHHKAVPGTTRRSAPESPPISSRGVLIAGSALVAAALVLFLIFSGGKNVPPPPDPVEQPQARPKPVPPPVQAPPKSPAIPAPATLKDLEALATSSTDPDAILQKCDEIRATIKGTPNEARFNAIEQRALEARKARDQERKVTRSIEQARKLIEDDHAVERQEEIFRLLNATREIAGDRRAEIDRLTADLQKKLKDAETAAKNPPPPPPPPPPPVPTAVVSFTLINADTDKPIGGFDPIPPGATINLSTLGTRNLNVRANTTPDKVGSVRFELDGTPFSVENVAPYALAGGMSGDYLPWTPSPGSRTITATPFALAKAAGTAGTPLILTLQVVDPASTGERSVSFQDGVSPTPLYAGTRDTELDESKPANSAGTAKKLEAEGDISGTGRDRYVLLRWDLTAIPPGSVVRSASVTLNVVGTGSKAPYPLHEIKREWGEKANWTLAQAGKAWEAPGAKGAQDRGAVLGSVVATKTGPVTVTLDTMVVQSWIDRPASNWGFLMANPDTGDALQIYSREAISALERPRLTIHFASSTIPPRKIHFAEDFNQGRGSFQTGDVVEGGVDGSRALSFSKTGAYIPKVFPAPVTPTLTVRVKVKPVCDLKSFEALIWSNKLKNNCWYRIRGLKKGEWNQVVFRVAEAREGWAMNGPSLEGDTAESLKFYFDTDAPDARVLIDDFEILD